MRERHTEYVLHAHYAHKCRRPVGAGIGQDTERMQIYAFNAQMDDLKKARLAFST